MERIVELIKQDDLRLKALKCVSQLNLPQCYIAAGFVRNMVWDWLHDYKSPTPLHDADVIYFDPSESNDNACADYEVYLRDRVPELNWQVRNQAKMHFANGDKPYQSTIDAMSYWPEKETAVAIRQIEQNEYEIVSAFGVESLFNFSITHNPKRSREIFERRVSTKEWLVKWPLLKTIPSRRD